MVRRLYQEFLKFLISTVFHGTRLNVILFTPIKEQGLLCALFRETHKYSTKERADLLWCISSKLDNKCEQGGEKFFCLPPPSKNMYFNITKLKITQ